MQQIAAIILMNVNIHWQLLSGLIFHDQSWSWGSDLWKLFEQGLVLNATGSYFSSGYEESYLGLDGNNKNGACGLPNWCANFNIGKYLCDGLEELLGIGLSLLYESMLCVLLEFWIVGESSCLNQINHLLYNLRIIPAHIVHNQHLL